jgi:hypothetical protein
MNRPPLPITRFLVVVSAVVPLVFASVMITSPALANSLIWPAPFEPVPAVAQLYVAMSYLSLTIGGFYALSRNTWEAAKAYLSVAGTYVALSLVLSLVVALTPPGVPLVVWLYVVLAALHSAVLVVAWRQESGRAQVA